MKPNLISALTISLALTSTYSTANEDPIGVSMISFFARDSELLLFNFNNQPVILDGWRFITSNSSNANIQTDPQGFDGITINQHSTLIIQLDNDADISGGINASDLGNFADYQSSAFAITLFCPDDKGQVAFDNPNQAVDHMQWSVNATHHPIADTQNQLAVDAGLWNTHDQWIDGREHMYLIELSGNQLSQLHTPEDYDILILHCLADLTNDGNTNFFDVSAFLNAFNQTQPAADMNHDGTHNFFDVSIFLNAYTTNAGCF